MSKSRWFKFYPGDFQSGTRGFTAAQRGAYISLICAAWESKDGTLPGDDARLRALAETDWNVWNRRGIKEPVLDKFERLPDGRIYNPRVMEERRKAGLQVVRLQTDESLTDESLTGTRNRPTKTKVAPSIRARASRIQNKNLTTDRGKEPARSRATPKGLAHEPIQAPIAKRQPPSLGLPVNGFPAAPRAINAGKLSLDELAKAEAEAIEFLAGLKH